LHKEEKLDFLFSIYGQKWFFGKIHEEFLVLKDNVTEDNLAKVGYYLYILWVKRGFFINKDGINDPAIEATEKRKRECFSVFVKSMKHFYTRHTYDMEKTQDDEHFEDFQAILEGSKDDLWGNIKDNLIFINFNTCFEIWTRKYGQHKLIKEKKQ